MKENKGNRVKCHNSSDHQQRHKALRRQQKKYRWNRKQRNVLSQQDQWYKLDEQILYPWETVYNLNWTVFYLKCSK